MEIKVKSAKQKDEERYSTDYLIVRRAIMENFIAHKSHIKEEDITPHKAYLIIYEVGKYFLEHNIRGLTSVPDV